MSSLSGVERRINLRLLSYWEKLRHGRDMPPLSEFNPDDLRDLWESCFLIEMAQLDKSDGHYKHLGQFIRDSYEQGTIKGDSGAMISPDPFVTQQHFRSVIASGKPLLDEGEFSNGDNKIVKYRQCLLPLGASGKVEAVFGGMNFKIFAVEDVNEC